MGGEGWSGSRVRRTFLEYFAGRGHERVPSSPLLNHGDPTVLFVNAGMNQFKDVFLGAETRPYRRASTVQKCLRISGKHNDFENVGVSPRHHTFFEMLGNFSFGDYFKEQAVRYGWEFLTSVVGLPKDRLWVTVFREDDDAAEIWKRVTDVDPGRILRCDEKDNFWAMGETGPCGPCSEIYYYTGSDASDQSEEGFRRDDGTYLEIWNLVFMQFDRDSSGVLTPLPAPSIDTGMGLERVAAVLQGRPGTYETDLLSGVIEVCEGLSGHGYVPGWYDGRRSDPAYEREIAFRVIADHSRAAAFLIADGVLPGSDGRGYLLRRIIRRAVRHGRKLGLVDPFLGQTTARVVADYRDAYPELADAAAAIRSFVDAEERKFSETLDAGTVLLAKEAAKVPAGGVLPGEVAFLLHDTFGFPLDLTEDALKEYGLGVDEARFEELMEGQRSRSRDERKAAGVVYSAWEADGAPTEFIGYSASEGEGVVTHVRRDGDVFSLHFDKTPFYAESGGQAADHGTAIIGDGPGGAELRVTDVHKVRGVYHVHECVLVGGDPAVVRPGARAFLSVDRERRRGLEGAHTATHALQLALREALGTHVRQAGSKVEPGRLRFDFTHPEPVDPERLAAVAGKVTAYVMADREVRTESTSIEEAKASGALALFGERYADVVRVVRFDGGPSTSESAELCGGTHVRRLGEVGPFVIVREEGVSTGVRRVEALTGAAAHRHLTEALRALGEAAAALKVGPAEVPDRVDRVVAENAKLRHEVAALKGRVASDDIAPLVSSAVSSPSGVRVVAGVVEGADVDALRATVDTLRVRLGSCVVVLGSARADSAVMVAGVTKDLVGTIDAGALLKTAAAHGGGRGGGRRDFAQAGGLEPSRVRAAIDVFVRSVG